MVSSPATHYRARMVYGDLRESTIEADELALPTVKTAALAVARWVERFPYFPQT